jgi:hypothetical protein
MGKAYVEIGTPFTIKRTPQESLAVSFFHIRVNIAVMKEDPSISGTKIP